jgi:hypothetical protein
VANHLKGEVERQVLGKKVVFRLGNNEMIELQGALDLAGKDEEFLACFDNYRDFRLVRMITFYALKKHQPEITEDQAGDIVTELGLEEMAKIRKECLRWALPEPEPRKGGAPARPSGGPTSS